MSGFAQREPAGGAPAGRRRPRLLVRLAFLGSGVLVALVLAEVALRVLAPDVDDYYVWRPHLQMTFRPADGVMPGIEGEAHFKVNALGLRGDELGPEHDFRMLAVGGSTTECAYVDQGDAWPQRLADELNRRQDRLRVWVGNSAKSGLNARHNLVQLQQLLPRLPRIDLVILLAGVNDLTVRLAKDADYDPDFMSRPDARAELLPRAFQMIPIEFRRNRPLLERTALWGVLSDLKAALLPRAVVLDERGSNYQVWREHRRTPAAVREELPDLRSALAEFRRNLAAQIDLCREHGARVLLLTQPSIWRPDLPGDLERLLWFGGVGEFQDEPGCEYYSVTALARGMEAFNRAQQAEAEERGVEFFDLAAALPKDASVFYDDVHFNTAGSRRVAELLADYLMQRAPFAR